MRYQDLPNSHQQACGVRLGLSHAQVMAPNFGAHTISAIKAEMKKGALLEDAFEKYRDLNNIETRAMTELGLIRAQVMAPNFGYHTISAIKAEMKKGASREDAFEKYRNRNNIEIQAMLELGLTCAQVLVPNFGDHTVKAIKAEIKNGTLLKDAFEKYRHRNSVEI